MPTPQIDIVLDAAGDLLFVNGDFSMAESTLQHQQLLLLNDKGDYKQNPTIDVGLTNYLDDDDGLAALSRAITMEFARDGMRVNKIQITNTNLTTDAYYP